jgi:hypothetical protein
MNAPPGCRGRRVRDALATTLTWTWPLLALAGCGRQGGDPPPAAPGSISAEAVRALPVEEADDLSVRQNLAQPRPPGLPGRAP